MAGKLRYWKEKDGRFWARIAVPARLRPFIDGGKSELIEPLGGDRRVALRLHPAAVGRLQHQITLAAQRANVEEKTPVNQERLLSPLTTADFGRAVWQRYTAVLSADDDNRERHPGSSEIAAAGQRLAEEVQKLGAIPSDPIAALNLSLDYLAVRDARTVDRHAREARLQALKREVAAGETHQVEHEIDAFLEARSLSADPGSAERSVLAKYLMRAEIEALQRTLERDQGEFGGNPSDPIVKAPAPDTAAEPVPLALLWNSYV